MSAWDPELPQRFRNRDRFTVAPAGRTAEASYRSRLVASRKQPGRPSFDAARSAWAASFALEPDDGIYLGELVSGTSRLGDIVDSLVVCGKKQADVVTALGRLVDAGLVVRAAPS